MADYNGSNKVTRVLFCGLHFPDSYNYTKQYLKDYPFIQVDCAPCDEVPNVIENYDICVVITMPVDSTLISRASRMKLLLSFAVGLEGIDIEAATRCRIKVARIPSDGSGNATACAEMTIYLMLGLLRKQNQIQVSVKQKKVGEPTGETLLGKTVFILGFGNIGIELAKRLRAFGVKIIATKRSWRSELQVSHQESGIEEDLVDEKGLHGDIFEFAGKADIVVLCLKMNIETAGIANKAFISSMRKGGLLVNIARGGLVEYEAVINNLKSGHLGGLATDVGWTEPFDPNDPISRFNNVIMTPHVGGVTEYSFRTSAKVVGDVVLQFQAGSPWTGIEFAN